MDEPDGRDLGSTGPDDDVRNRVLANEVRTEIGNSVAGALLLALAVLYFGTAFWGRVEPWLIIPWLLILAAGLVAWITALVLIVVRRPDDQELARGWAPAGRNGMILCNLVAMAGVWIFLPATDAGQLPVVLVIYMCFLSIQVLGATEATQAPAPAVLGVLASLIAYLLIQETPHSVPLSITLAVFGAAALVMRSLIRRAVIQATEAQALTEQAAAALEQALTLVAAERDAKTRFIQSASHDLQQPVQAADLYLDALLAEPDSDARALAGQGVREALGSTRALLDHMLQHLRLEARAVQVNLEPVALDDLISRTVRQHGPATRAAGMVLITPRSRLAVLADRDLLARALGNLVANAIRHARGERVLIGARRDSAGAVTLWVIDDGEGVSTADHQLLFEDFVQGAGQTGSGGFGLGLSSVRRIAALLDGSAGLDPRWKDGAAFFIRLPQAAVTGLRCARFAAPHRSDACEPA